jgi:hypothetical protein
MRINLRIFTTEYTEFHGGRKDFHTKTPWYSVTPRGALDYLKAVGITVCGGIFLRRNQSNLSINTP